MPVHPHERARRIEGISARGVYADAYSLIRATNPFPSVCGRVCYAPCEAVCNRGQVDDAVAIRALKRFAVDRST